MNGHDSTAMHCKSCSFGISVPALRIEGGHLFCPQSKGGTGEPISNLTAVSPILNMSPCSPYAVLLVQDGVNGNGCFTCPSISNNELSLAAANRDKTVNCLETGSPDGRCKSK